MRLLSLVHPGIVYNAFSGCVRAFVPLSAPCGVRVRHPLVFSGTQTCTLSRSVCVFCRVACVLGPLSCSVVPQNYILSCSVCFLPAAYTSPSKRETKKRALRFWWAENQNTPSFQSPRPLHPPKGGKNFGGGTIFRVAGENILRKNLSVFENRGSSKKSFVWGVENQNTPLPHPLSKGWCQPYLG